MATVRILHWVAGNPQVSRWSPLAQQASARYGIPAPVLLGLIQVESGGRPGLTSSASAHGITQFIPSTARSYGVNTNPGHERSQIFGTAKMLADLGYHQNPALALAKYNGGPGNPQMGYARQVLAARNAYLAYRHPQGQQQAVRMPQQGMLGGPSRRTTSQTLQSSTGDPGTGLAQLIAGLQQQQAQPRQASLLQAPSYSSDQRFGRSAGGATQVQSVGRAQTNTSISDALAALDQQTPGSSTTLSSTVTSQAAPGRQTNRAGHPPAPGQRMGNVIVDAGANRAGVGLQTPILDFLHRLSGQLTGRPVTVGTGTNHNQYVAGRPGVQSDHWRGNAADLPQPVSSVAGDRLAAHAISLAGHVPYNRALEMAHHGGLWNFHQGGHRIQILWKTNQGGNHFNHVHVGVS